MDVIATVITATPGRPLTRQELGKTLDSYHDETLGHHCLPFRHELRRDGDAVFANRVRVSYQHTCLKQFDPRQKCGSLLGSSGAVAAESSALRVVVVYLFLVTALICEQTSSGRPWSQIAIACQQRK